MSVEGTESVACRFLPWVRRGVATTLAAPSVGPPPQRAVVTVAVRVAGAGTAETSVTLLGPGDVIGLDGSTIARRAPRPGTANAQPDTLVAIDFDAPDLPWAFTPFGPAAPARLPPWLVLVVVEDRPGVRIAVPPGGPLPLLEITSGAAAELPDLADAWAWAHAQLAVPDGEAVTADALDAHPERSVSRLIAPRRLRADARWHACLVPAFDAGVIRGRGGVPDPGAPLAPAWDAASLGESITLPLYHHWSFGTGPAGDFESLARRLRPRAAAADIGRVRMHVGAASPALALPADDPGRHLDMDGALRAPGQADAAFADVSPALSDGLRQVAEIVADAADGTLGDGGPGDPATEPLGPPVYGAHHARRVRLDDHAPEWLRELNRDPRSRVAAGLGAEVVRANQEAFIHAAWQQVGAVQETNALLSRSRLGLEAARRFHRRHIMPLGPGRLLQLAAPLAARTPLGERNVRAAIRRTSLPDAVLDPALRRVMAPTSRPVARAARRIGAGGRARLVERLAPGAAGIDPTRFERPVISGFAGDARPPVVAGRVDLTRLGLPSSVGEAVAEALFSRSALLRATLEATAPADFARLRDGLEEVGLLGAAHLAAARRFLATCRTAPPPDVLGAMSAAFWSHRHEAAAAFVVEADGVGGVRVTGVDAVNAQRAVVAGRIVVPPPHRRVDVLHRYRAAVDDTRSTSSLGERPRSPRVVAFDLDAAAAALRARCNPALAFPARLSAQVTLAGAPLVAGGGFGDGWRVAPLLDRVMAWPVFDVPAAFYLARHDRSRFVPGIDAVPPESITLLESNPRFVAAFLAGMNHEMNRELLWRGYPTDRRGSPFRRFWDRLDASPDIAAMHQWSAGRLAAQTGGGKANLVLLLRGELLRRHPDTLVIARPAVDGIPSMAPDDIELPVFAGAFEPDVAFFGFDLEASDLEAGWYFGLVEPIGEPRFGFDESADPERGVLDRWDEVAWSDVTTTASGWLRPSDFAGLGALPAPGDAAAIAAALFQQPFELLVHASHLTTPAAEEP